MTSLMQHAKRELQAAGYGPDKGDLLDYKIYDATLRIVAAFESCGHSGSSAAAHTALISHLLQYKNLTPITTNVHDWIDVSDMMGRPCWQNRRDSSMFSEDGGRTYYSVHELRHGWRAKLFGREGKIYRSEVYEGD